MSPNPTPTRRRYRDAPPSDREAIMRRSYAILLGTLAIGCAPEGGELEVREQPQQSSPMFFRSPFGEFEPVAMVVGRLGQNGHYVVYQRRSTGACWFNQWGGPDGLRSDVDVELSQGEDWGVVALEHGSTLLCNGVIYRLTAPRLDYIGGDGVVRSRAVNVFGLDGNDFLSCNHHGTCRGGGGNDELATWASVSSSEPVSLDGGSGNDKLVVSESVPVIMQGGSGSDCLYHPNPGGMVLSYECSQSDTGDPDWDKSSGFIGRWCNEIETQECSTWPW